MQTPCKYVYSTAIHLLIVYMLETMIKGCLCILGFDCFLCHYLPEDKKISYGDDFHLVA